jgi:hypothetical protein
MDWIKKNPDRFILALFALILVGVAVVLFLSAQSFGEKFSEALQNPPPNNTIPAVDTARITEAKTAFETPKVWKSNNHSGLLFTSEQYYVKDGKLEGIKGSIHVHSRSGDQIPNEFFTNNGLPLMDPSVIYADPDGDGFSNQDEWLNTGLKDGKPDSTDPKKKESHPPYYTQLFLKTWNTTRFRWEFKSYDGDPNQPAMMTLAINPLDLRGPTQFLKIGENVAGTQFKLKSFTFKEVDNPATGVKKDVSELTLVSTDTNEEVTLPLNTVVDSPTRFGDFEYRWNKKNTEAGAPKRIQRLKEFNLEPEVDVKYKLLDGNPQNAVIQLPDGQSYTVPLLKK